MDEEELSDFCITLTPRHSEIRSGRTRRKSSGSSLSTFHGFDGGYRSQSTLLEKEVTKKTQSKKKSRLLLCGQKWIRDWDSEIIGLSFFLVLLKVLLCLLLSYVLIYHQNQQLIYVQLVGFKADEVITFPLLCRYILAIGGYGLNFVLAMYVAVSCSILRRKIARSQQMHTLTNSVILPCYEPIAYSIAFVALLGLFLDIYAVRLNSTRREEMSDFPLMLRFLPVTWLHLIVPILMIQYSVSKQAIIRSISNAVCVSGVFLAIVYFTWKSEYLLDMMEDSDHHEIMHLLLFVYYIGICLYYLWAIFSHHPRPAMAYVFYFSIIYLGLLGLGNGILFYAKYNLSKPHENSKEISIIVSVIFVSASLFSSFDAFIYMLCFRADTKFWLGLDSMDKIEKRIEENNPMRVYINEMSDLGLVSSFSTCTSVYGVHQMIEEHKDCMVNFSALKIQEIIAEGATAVVMRGELSSTNSSNSVYHNWYHTKSSICLGGKRTASKRSSIYSMEENYPTSNASIITVAVKMYTSFYVTDEELVHFSRETALNAQLNHPNIVKFYGLYVFPPTVALVFEYCYFGSLDLILSRQNQSQFTELMENKSSNGEDEWDLSTKMKMWLDATKAVSYLHQFNPPLLHRDIKTGNYLLGDDYNVKLTDFGESNLFRPRLENKNMTIAGTVDFMAPELILASSKSANYNEKVDIYSLAITLWCIFFPGKNPWASNFSIDENSTVSHLHVYDRVLQGQRPFLPVSMPEGCRNLLEKAWSQHPADRPDSVTMLKEIHQLWLLSTHRKTLRRTKCFWK